MTRYAVLDTNVLVSALLTKYADAATVQVVYAVLRGEITPLVTQEILEEYREVLKRPRFGFREEQVERLLSAFRQYGLTVQLHPTGETLPDPDDLIFYEVVMEKRDEGAHLVTGNIRHFPKQPFIVTPAEMLALLHETPKNE